MTDGQAANRLDVQEAPVQEVLAEAADAGPPEARDTSEHVAPQTESAPDLAESPAPPPVADLAPGAGRIGLLLPLTGRYADAGETLLRAAELALFDSGLDDLVLLPRDTTGTATGAETAARALLDDGVDLILGPLLADGVRAVAPHAARENVAMIAFSTDRTAAGAGVYLIGHTPRAQIRRVIAYAAALGHRRIALLAPRTRYGQTSADEAADAAAHAGLAFAGAHYYAADGSDAEDAVRRLAARQQQDGGPGALPFDALLLPDGGARLRQVAPLLPYYDIDPAEVRLLGTGLWDDPATLGEPALNGGLFAAPDPAARQRFAARYEAAFGAPPGAIASLGYDATALAAALALRNFDRNALASRGGFLGVDGIFRFDEDGVAERGLAVLEATDRAGAALAAPAPERFPPGA